MFSIVEGQVAPIDSNGLALDVPDATALPAGTRGFVSVGYDGTSTRFVRVDSSGRLTVAIATALPAGSNAIGSVAQSGTWSTTVTQATAANLNATVVGTVTANAGSGTFAVSASALPLPSGASTEATLGTVATNTGRIPSQGQALMIASLPVVIASNQTAVPMSAASLPLPTGAATAAKQPALGVAGTASADVITVQGIASMTALKIDGSATTQPISGTVTANIGTSGSLALDATLTGGSQKTKLIDAGGTNTATVKAASTAAAGTDPALVVAVSPNNSVATTSAQLPAALGQTTKSGSLPITLASDQGNLSVSIATAIPAGSNAIGTVTVLQGTAANLNATVKLTDGTNFMPTMDVVARKGFHAITDGTSTAAVKAASTAAATTDPALVVGLSPNSPLATTAAANNAALSTSIVAIGGVGTATKPTAVSDANGVRAWYSTSGRAHTESDPGYDFAAVTTNDAANLPTTPTRALYVGVGGDIVVDSSATTSITFKNVPPGTMLPLAVFRVRATGTTASSIVAIY